MPENKKTTAPIPVVGAAGEQSNGHETIGIIPKESAERNWRNGSFATVSMLELYDTAYPPKAVLIDSLLYAGTYLFVGAPKIGKSFFMAQAQLPHRHRSKPVEVSCSSGRGALPRPGG